MDPDQMAEQIQELREWRAEVSPSIDRIEKRSESHSGTMKELIVALAEVRLELKHQADDMRHIVGNIKWWMMFGVAILGAVLKWL